MRIRMVLPSVVALALGIAGPSWAQGASSTPTPTAPDTTAPTAVPPEKLQGSTTTSNPATAGTAAPNNQGVRPTGNNAVNVAPANTPGAPVAGANSFTEGEAKARIESKGFTQVSNLKLDGQGVWRGSAMRDGKPIQVALDYQGNVVGQ